MKSDFDESVPVNHNCDVPYSWVHWVGQYIEWSQNVFGQPVSPIIDSAQLKCSASFDPSSKYGQIALRGLFEAELAYCADLIADLRDNKVQGELAEFGVFRGDWINRLFDMTEQADFKREIWGFDSFEGLSNPDPSADSSFWEAGMFAAGLAEVQRNVLASERPRIKLVPGWFAESLQDAESKKLEKISYARIDCDLYQPALECLEYLGPRLSHGSILVFDDWPHKTELSEARAFAEWVETVPHLEFQFLFYSGWDHFYVRVWHKGLTRFAS